MYMFIFYVHWIYKLCTISPLCIMIRSQTKIIDLLTKKCTNGITDVYHWVIIILTLDALHTRLLVYKISVHKKTIT